MPPEESGLPGTNTRRGLSGRGTAWGLAVIAGASFAGLVLVVFLLSIVNDAFGYVSVAFEIAPWDVGDPDDREIRELDRDQLITAIRDNVSAGVLRRLISDEPLEERSLPSLRDAAERFVFRPHVTRSWSLTDSIFGLAAIRAYEAEHPEEDLHFRSWVTPRFFVSHQAPEPENSGIRAALLGTLWLVVIAVVVAVPLGVAAAVFLNEYTPDTPLVRIVRVNVENLAAIPSIIYGMLGLAVFVRALAPITSGAAFGLNTEGLRLGRTVLAGGLTLAVLVLPIIIINARDAFAAIPKHVREACYAVGARRFQTIRTRLLPFASQRLITTVILAMSRVIGETAPVIVIGAATFITTDPAGIFSRFTTLPATVYALSTRPQAEFQRVAAAAIIVLLLVSVLLNVALVILRNRLGISRRRR